MKNAVLLKDKAISAKRSGFGRTFSAWMLFVVVSLASLGVSGQTRTVTGTVLDTENTPVIGASILLQGVSRGAVTDANGKFALPNVPANGILEVMMMGYITQEIPVNNRTSFDIILQEDTKTLEQVVVVGYGVQRKSDVTGAVISVGEDMLQDRPVSNPFEALQGKAAGVDITNNARPGEVGTIRIRGERSITGGSNPLYVVDGVPITNNSFIAGLNTYDIKSIEILKDASATAIYGSRGANGVILITTQRGEEGRFSINYNGSLTIETLQDSRELFNASEWIDFRRWAYYYSNPEIYPRADQPSLATDKQIFGADQYAWRNVEQGWASGSWDGSKVETTDWTQFIKQTGITHNHSLAVSGGTDRIRSYASFGYLNQEGTSKGQGYERYTANINTTIKPKKWFEMGAMVNAQWSVQEYGQDGTGAPSSSGAGSIYESAMRLYPYAVPFDDNGDRIQYPGGDNSLRTVVDEWKYSQNHRELFNVIGSLYAQINFMEGLTYKFSFGPSYRFRRNGLYVDPNSAIRENPESLVQLNNQRDFTWTLDNLITYNKTFGKHTVTGTLLQTATKVEEIRDNINGKNVPVPSALWNNMGAIDRINDITGVGSDLAGDQLTSYMIRGNYVYNDRYIITASGRWDGHSRLAPGNKWSFFPSVAAAWRLDQEDFLKPVTWVNQLKLRVGYGVTGNAAVGRYSTLGDIQSSLYPYGSDTYRFYYINDLLATSGRKTLPNKDLGWEKTGQFNVGIDFSLLHSRISGVIDVYTSRTTDLLLTANIPSLTGYITTTANLGETRNKGIDITLNTINVVAGDFRWETNLNVAWQKNKITELANGKEDDISNSRFIGQPIGIYYDYQNQGIWREEDAEEMAKFNSSKGPDGQPKTAHNFKVGQVRPTDQNGDYVIDANNDRVIIGQSRPSWTGGMTNTFSFKGFELMIQVYGRMGYWSNVSNVSMGGRYMLRKVDYYNENNKNASYQRPEFVADGSDKDPYANLLRYEKASFINIRNISLGYVFPKSMIQRLGIQNLRVYVQCVNPGAVYQSLKFRNMDVNSSVWNRNYVFGLNIGF